jgi:hypothetical protein
LPYRLTMAHFFIKSLVDTPASSEFKSHPLGPEHPV